MYGTYMEYIIKYNIKVEDFARSFETDVEEIEKYCSDIIDTNDFSYSFITGHDYDKLILNILKKIDEDKQVIGDSSRKKVWEDGWKENLNEFVNSNYDLEKLIPKFIRRGQEVRYNTAYIRPSNPDFELNYYRVFRQWLFKRYLSKYENIYEFGCGTGFNLVSLARLYPDKKLYGLDFVPSSIDIMDKIAEHYKFNITGKLFDMISPDYNIKLKENSAIFSIGSIEQLAGKFNNFINYLLEQPISLVIHVEPVIELYQENNLADYLAIKFQSKRGYTKDFLPYLRKLESDKTIDLLKVKRLFFGSLYMEGYNLLVWRPKCSQNEEKISER